MYFPAKRFNSGSGEECPSVSTEDFETGLPIRLSRNSSQKVKVLRQSFATRKCHGIQAMYPNPRRPFWLLDLWIEPFRGIMQRTPSWVYFRSFSKP